MMMRRKWWKLALAFMVLLIAAQAGASFAVGTRRMHGYLIAHLERAFGRPVQVGKFKVQILPTPQLDADGVTVGEDPAFGYEYFLRAERLGASLRWTGLLRGHFEFGTLSLSRPSLNLVRDAEGKWNLERWLPPAKANAPGSARVYGPQLAALPTNYLEKIEVDEGRINFKNAGEKLPFAFTGVTGSVEQIAPGRWQLQLEAQPWRSGVAMQSTGTLRVRGDIAGTSARLQPAEFSVHWDKVSLADLFRLFSGQDYGVRGDFALEGSAKSGASVTAQVGDWTFALQARGTQIHRWDLTERADNPRVNLNMKGRWNVVVGSVVADQMTVELPMSNLRGMGKISIAAAPSWEVQVNSTTVHAADLLAWYRAFQPGVADGVTAEQSFTGAMSARGWPLTMAEAAIASPGGVLKVPGLDAPLRIGTVSGGMVGMKFAVQPVRISLGGEIRASATLIKTPAAGRKKQGEKLHATPEPQNAIDVGWTQDLQAHSGGISFDGRVERVEETLKIFVALGKTLNHGWELTGGGSGALRWDWKDFPLRGKWNGTINVSQGQLQVAGLNQPIKVEEAQLEWKEGERRAQILQVAGFGANWTGEIVEPNVAEGKEGPKWSFKLYADHLDAAELDRWVGPRARPNWLEKLLPTILGGGATSGTTPSELLRRVNAEGELRVDELSVEKLKLGHVRAEIAVRELQVDVRDAQAEWAGGNVHAKLHAAFTPLPKYDVTAELDGVNVALVPGVRLAERFAGVASGTVQLTTEGVGRDELLKKLSGKGEVRLKNAEFRGWDVPASAEEGAPRLGTSRWSAGEGAFVVRDQTIVLDGLELDAPLAKMIVRGTVSFARNADLTIETTNAGKHEARAAASSRMLKISGPLEGLHLTVESTKASQPAD